MGTSKNSKKGSKPTQMVAPKRVKEKKKTILVEITKETYDRLISGQDLSTYDNGMKILDMVSHYGKKYLKLAREQ